MNLRKKRILASKVLNVGKNRIIFSNEALSEIKEVVTRQDIKGLYEDGLIRIKPFKGKKKVKKRKTKRGSGKIKKKVRNRKQIYVKITRKLRSYIKELKNRDVISKDLYYDLRKKIRSRYFKSKTNLKDYLINLNVELNYIIKKSKEPIPRLVKSSLNKNIKNDKNKEKKK